jgi:adenosylcobinamide kinase/adenosylcobinamide-phosphate guanylyltransferase
MNRVTVVGGGVRSGKSAFALRLAMQYGGPRAFVATAEALDGEMRARIARHVAERADRFDTIEAPRDLEDAVTALRGRAEVVVIDCLTLWLSNLLLAGDASAAIEARVEALASALRGAPFASIVVTNEVGMGIVPESELGRRFRDVAGRAHQVLARRAGHLYLATLGVVMRVRPGPVQVVDPEEPA